MKKRYVLGVDFGTLSARALLIDAESGSEVAEASCSYPHGVMDMTLPCGKKLPPKYALQHPSDYLDVLGKTVRNVLTLAGVSPEEVAGMGIDFTTCTWLPIDTDGTPLCLLPRYENEPHAYVKLWKHHGATTYAEEIDRVAVQRKEKWFSVYGQKSSSEWALAKTLETLREAPKVFDDAYRFMEVADWLSLLLTGKETHGINFAGLKAFWSGDHGGFPGNDYMKAVDPRFDNIIGGKLSASVNALPEIAGTLNDKGAALTGLNVGTPLALPIADAHAAVPGLNVTKEGDLLLIVGTSSVHMVNAKERHNITGICGYVKDGVIPGYYIYEAGQAGCGDCFDWFVKNCIPAAYRDEADKRGISIHAYLREKAIPLTPGESGLLALDWWNGSRSPLKNDCVSGTILGLTMTTKPEEIYRALIEATAFGTRQIIENFENGGIAINNICAAGGIALKDAMMMHIYADVTGRTIHVARTAQAAARGSAVMAAVAAGLFSDIKEAAAHFAQEPAFTYHPNPKNHEIYNKLYAEYRRLHDYFGKEQNTVMQHLSDLSRAAKKL